MALGGWVYHTYLIPSFDHTNDTLFESNVIDPMISLISGISGWSVQTAKTKYVNSGSDTAWYFEMVHTSGAVLSVVWIGYAPGGTYFIDATNTINEVAYSAAVVDQRVIFSYWPPGNSGSGAANPLAAGYVPSDGFSFMVGSRQNSVANGHTLRFHFMARGDDLIVVSEYDAVYADTVVLMGSCVEPYHASDTGSRSNEAHVLLWNDPATDRPGAVFSSDNTTKVWYLSLIVDNFSWLTSSVNDAEPWSYVQLILARVLWVGATASSSGITSTSGIKGRISTEWIRKTSSACGTKQQLVSGNLIHVGSGYVVGWDPSNGAMT